MVPDRGAGPTWRRRGPKVSRRQRASTGDAGADSAGIEIAGSVPARTQNCPVTLTRW